MKRSANKVRQSMTKKLKDILPFVASFVASVICLVVVFFPYSPVAAKCSACVRDTCRNRHEHNDNRLAIDLQIKNPDEKEQPQ